MNMPLARRKQISLAILHCLAYFDIFNHPLRLEEILRFCPMPMDVVEAGIELDYLKKAGLVYEKKDLYSLQGDKEDVLKRLSYNREATRMLPIAKANSTLIQKFPFVKGACVSGSLSKGVFKEEDDIDYFIITQKGRIWVSRLFLKLYKFFWLRNSKDYFCINYFISESDLCIKEKNLYTSIELITLLPMTSEATYEALKKENQWVFEFLPNASWPEMDFQPPSKPLLSKGLEILFSWPIGDLADYAIMKAMKWRHRLKYRHLHGKSSFRLMFKSTRTESKIHPNNTSARVLEEHQEKVSILMERI